MDRIGLAFETIREELEMLRRRQHMTENTMYNLHELHRLIFIEACHDPDNEHSKEFAKKLLPFISDLNKELKFKN